MNEQDQELDRHWKRYICLRWKNFLHCRALAYQSLVIEYVKQKKKKWINRIRNWTATGSCTFVCGERFSFITGHWLTLVIEYVKRKKNKKWINSSRNWTATGSCTFVCGERFLHIINAWQSSLTGCQFGRVIRVLNSWWLPASLMNNELCFDNTSQLC